MEVLNRIQLAQFAQSLTWLDILILTLVGFTTIMGLWSGLVWQLYRIVSLVLGFALASRFGPAVSESIGDRIGSSAARQLVAYVLMFAVVVLVCYMIGRLIKKLIDRAKLGPADRAFGALFGFLKGALICGVIIIGVLNSASATSKFVQEINRSEVALGIVRVCEHLWVVLPADLRSDIATKMDKARQEMETEKDDAKERLREGAKEAVGEAVDREIDRQFGKQETEDQRQDWPRYEDGGLAPTADGVE